MEKKLYINRELSWLDFNNRILDLSNREDILLLERLNFLAITESNLDEFLMVRLGYLTDKLSRGNHNDINYDGTTFIEEYNLVKDKIIEFKNNQNISLDNLLVKLNEHNVNIVKYEELDEEELSIVDEYFNDYIFHTLTPLTIDTGKAFPNIKTTELQLVGLLSVDGGNKDLLFNINIPKMLSRVVRVKENKFIMVDDLIINKLDKLFIGNTVKDVAYYRIFRSDYIYNDVVVENNNAIINRMRENLKLRDIQDIVWVDTYSMSKKLRKVLVSQLNCKKSNIFNLESYLDKSFLFDLKGKIKGLSKFKYSSFKAPYPEDLLYDNNIFDIIDNEDMIIHHPYESFDHILNFIEAASNDPQVISIKQTLYRISSNSPIIDSLINAVNKGKQVTVFVELKARFNERENIDWVKTLQDVGCNVIYGIEDYKVHCKMCLVVRKGKRGKLQTYTHIGTGNYNDKTAKLYTDISILTSNSSIGDDVATLFNSLTGYSKPPSLKKLIYAPVNMKSTFIELIEKEIENQLLHNNGYIFIKCNSINEIDIIDKLYEAASKGVKIDLVVRGVCCMKAVENIFIKSIVGRYLEHSRIYKFNNNNDNIIYISSADLMYRNLNKRFEIACPVKKSVGIKINKIIDIALKDTENSYIMDEFGVYHKYESIEGEKLRDSHKILMKISQNKNSVTKYKKF